MFSPWWDLWVELLGCRMCTTSVYIKLRGMASSYSQFYLLAPLYCKTLKINSNPCEMASFYILNYIILDYEPKGLLICDFGFSVL